MDVKRVFTAYVLLAALYLALMFSGLPLALLVMLKVAPVSLLLVFALLRHGAPQFLPIALFFSACGDALLALPLQYSFVLGLGAFVMAQLSYASGFFPQRQLSSTGARLRLGAVTVYLFLLAIVLLPRTGETQVAVALYILAIGTMAATAAMHRAPSAFIFTGAAVFVLSDSMIAIERFADPFNGSRYAVMTTYYTSQALLTYGIIKFHERNLATVS